LIVLTIGLPSYGIILVYNLEMNFKGAMNGLAIKDVNSIYDESDFKLISKRTPKAFMVLDISDTNDADYFVENAGLIPYNVAGKKYIDDANVTYVSLLRLSNRNVKYHHLWILDFDASNAVADVNNLDTQNIRMFGARIIGKAFTDQKLRFVREDVGEVASTMNGCALLDTGISSPIEMFGTTTVKASLSTTFTRQINNPSNPELGGITFSGVIEELKTRLDKQGYTAVIQGDGE